MGCDEYGVPYESGRGTLSAAASTASEHAISADPPPNTTCTQEDTHNILY
jgi:hypothetical protein